MTYREAIELGEKILNMANIVDAKNDAWLLLTAACKIDHTFYYMHMDEDMDSQQVKEFECLIKKRAEHIPLQYITGEQEFMGMTFHVNSNVLIPRQDTETLVEQALKRVKPGMHILDMCTGSGCILISLMHYSNDCEGVGADISPDALQVANRNRSLLPEHKKLSFIQSDLFEHVEGRFDVIVSNPPYIAPAEYETLMPEVKEHEPRIALVAEEDGLAFYRRMIQESPKYLYGGGRIFFEIGSAQAEGVCGLLEESGFTDIHVVKDYAGLDRVVYGTRM